VRTGRSDRRFLGPGASIEVAGRRLDSPLVYVATELRSDEDASTIVTSCAVGDPNRAMPLPYWPQYTAADPSQRAVYLDWLASGRANPDTPIGYVFIFFYGLERRVFVDREDAELACSEVARLRSIYKSSNSFTRYTAEFLAFAWLDRKGVWLNSDETFVDERLSALVGVSPTALCAALAWYQTRARPLPAYLAAAVVRDMPEAKRGIVVERSSVELLDLFRIRYEARFGSGISLATAKRQLNLSYGSASASVRQLTNGVFSIPNVLGRVAQFRPVVAVWNECIDDLRKSSARRAGAKGLDPDAWAALPPELRVEYDHPHQDRWDTKVQSLPVLGGFHVGKASELAKLADVEVGEKLSAAAMRRIAQRAEDLGYAIEPEPRLRGKGAGADAEILIWRDSSGALPEAPLYVGVHAVLVMLVSIAMADGNFSEEEHGVVNSFLTEAFNLDQVMRTRVEAMKHLVVRHPAKVQSFAKALVKSQSIEQRGKIAAVLVAVAAVDGLVTFDEEKTLRTLYGALGLGERDLITAMSRVGARLESDAAVEVAAARPSAGSPIPQPTEQQGIKLSQAVIDSILADTREVASLLAEVFDDEEVADELEPPAQEPSRGALTTVSVSAKTTRIAGQLDIRYHGVLDALLQRRTWSVEEVKRLATEHRMMPGAILDVVNSWSDEVLGDFLIEEGDGWTIHSELVKEE